MRTLVALLMLATALAAPNASADFCDGDPSAMFEVCKDTGTYDGLAHGKDIEPTGCLIDVDGTCVPRSVTVSDGPAIGPYSLPTAYVGVDSNEACLTIFPPPYMPDPPVPTGLTFNGCGAGYSTAPLTAYVAESVL